MVAAVGNCVILDGIRHPACVKNRNGFIYSDPFHIDGNGAGPECVNGMRKRNRSR